ncbi:MAG: hypothetical protein ABH869_00720 [Candidatus Omnitrophota bacterium]
MKKKYLDLIASLGSRRRNFYWWATALSEKNSFTSKFFIRTYQLFCLDRAIDGIKSDVYIVSSDPVLKTQIISNYSKKWTIKYSFFFPVLYRLNNFTSFWKGLAKQVLRACAEYRKIWICRALLKEKKKVIKESDKYTVLRGWVDSRNYKSGKYEDAYFKKLPGFLRALGKNVLIFAGGLSEYEKIIKKFKKDKGNLIIPFNFYLKGIDILKNLVAVYCKRPVIRKDIFLENCNISEIIKAELLTDIEFGSFFNAGLQFFACKRLASSVLIESFIYTFENYSWEKMSILGIRETSPGAKIIGFQHAFISKNNFKYLTGRGEESICPLPDRIVTMGKRTLDIMKNYGNYPEGIFVSGCALRQEYLFGMERLCRNTGKDVFVPLTITIQDTVKVFRFLYDAGMAEYPGNIYFRFHPATRVKEILEKLSFSLPANFVVSDKVLIKEEMERCSVVLYTWTTVCLEALKMGRPVIYLDVNYPLEVDPLFECGYLKDVCRNSEELIEKIKRMQGMDESVFSLEAQKAREYIDEYFLPVNNETMRAFL